MKFKESKSIYLQISDRIMDEILQGTYKEEERIPSVREYAAMVEVNANTMMRAYDYLQSMEIIYNKRGIGYFVENEAKNKIMLFRKQNFLEIELPEVFRNMVMLGIDIQEISALYKQFIENNK